MKPGDLTLGETPAGLHVHQFVERQQQRLKLEAGLTSLVLAASCWHCFSSELNTMENTAVPGARGEELLQQVQREHVVYEEWSQCSAVQC